MAVAAALSGIPGRLAGLLDPRWKVEIEAEAQLPSDRPALG